MSYIEMFIRIISGIEPVTSILRSLPYDFKSNGWKVEIVSSTNQYQSRRDSITDHFKTIDGINVSSIPFQFDSSSIGKRIINTATSIIYFLYLGIRKPASHTIYFTQPPMSYTCGWLLKKMYGRRYSLYLNDIYPDIAFVVQRNFKIFKWILFLFQHASFKNADKIFVIGRCMQSKLLSKGVSGSRIITVHNSTSARFVDEGLSGLVSSLSDLLEKQNIILYSGNIGLAHDLTTLVSSARKLLNIRPDISFIIVGGGSNYELVKESAKDITGKNMYFFSPVDQKSLNMILSAAPVHFITLRENFHGLVVPSKFYSSFVTARKIIFEGNSECEIAQLIRELGVGEVVNNHDADTLFDILRGLDFNDMKKPPNNRKINKFQQDYNNMVIVDKILN
jgi:colanic acid biosynthesis glycosyl transferase WcaI